jgi:hypothetical protein
LQQRFGATAVHVRDVVRPYANSETLAPLTIEASA